METNKKDTDAPNSDDQVKKFFTLIKSAQNEALISLIADGLKSELSNSPLRVSQKILEFCKNELVRSEVSDFTRQKASEGLMPILNGVQIARALFDSKTQSGSLEKQCERMERSSAFVVKLDQNHFTGVPLDLIANKEFFQKLIQLYQPLLASGQDAQDASANTDPKQNREATKQGIKNVVMGKLSNIQSIKLSDMIDTKFLEDVEGGQNTLPQTNPNQKKLQLSELMSDLEKKCDSLFISHTLKRQKADEGESKLVAKYVILSPLLSLALMQCELLLSPEWRKRHSAACQLRHIFETADNFDYSVVSIENGTSLKLQENFTLSKQKLAQNLISRLLIVMLKDNFSDFEGLKVLPPVRDECVKLLSTIVPSLKEETMKLIGLLPNVFMVVERDQWHSKLNFFLILKGLVLKGDKEMKQCVLKIFGQMLIVAIPAVEDEPKVTITELLMILLPTYLASFKTAKIPVQTLQQLLDNLSLNLQKADEVTASAIAVFNLVCKVFELRHEFPKILSEFKFKLNLQIFAAFNFHKLEPVRLSYNQLMLQALQSGSFNESYVDLSLIHTLTVQSLAMESNQPLIETLCQVLEQTIRLFPVSEYQKYLEDELLQDHKLASWLNAVSPDFKSFTFIELASFQSINEDYFQVVFRPANEVEWDTFFNSKTRHLTKAVAVMLSSGKCTNYVFDQLSKHTQVQQQLQSGQVEAQTLLNQSMLFLMFSVEQYARMLLNGGIRQDNFEIVDWAYLQDLAIQLLQSDDRDICVNDCWHLAPILDILQQLISLSGQGGHQPVQEALMYLNDCFQEMINSQTFRSRHEDFDGLINDVYQRVYQLGQPHLTHLYMQLCAKYQDVMSYLGEYSMRLKASAAGTLLGIAMIHRDEADPEQQASFLSQILNLLIKPLLNQINQERVSGLKLFACDAVCDLLEMLSTLEMWAPLKRVIALCLKMVTDHKDEVTLARQNALEHMIQTLVSKHGQTVYVKFKGIFGSEVLKPKLKSDNVDGWLKIARIFLTSHKQAGKEPGHFDKSQGLMVKLALQCLDLRENSDQDILQLPAFFTSLFNCVNQQQQVELMETLVTQMQAKHRSAFNCLNALLDQQTEMKASTDFLKFVPLFVLPVIMSLSQQSQIYCISEEKKVMKILAKLIQILPLNIASLDSSKSSNLSEELQKKISEGLDFLKVFAENQIVDEYEIKVKVNAKLRSYQLQGINWMARLGSYNLNCILCDDMGLGKTVQSLTVVLNESLSQKNATNLVVCPTSLTYNWSSEIKKFFTNVKVGIVEGSEKNQILDNASQYDIIVINYEKVKYCLPQLQQIKFFYIVLDEAHKIKNSKAQVTQSVRQLQGQRKIALSGTPLQNRVSELWSLFDFILPDFLEDESTFNKTYNKYLTGNIKRMQEKLEDTQQFINALKSLKRRIAPFILRRTKEDVLKELPPKVIQDYNCQMPDMQFQVHQIVERHCPFTNVVGKGGNSLQNLILHRKMCNHPVLVKGLIEGLPAVQAGYQNSGKLLGLAEILTQCEILQQQETKEANEGPSLFDAQKQQHRALIFCQMQSFMQIVQKDVLDHFGVKYLTMQGSMSPKERIDIANEFNSNPQHKVLLLTTTVGGLGLTLTGADVVIFVEHDWNPMKDLQAMDRAHRLGQTKTVNVYRLIVKDTIEEKIMSLQRFKENLARSLVQSRSETGTNDQLADDKQLDLNDLLKSFEEHTAYQSQIGTNEKKKSDKPMTMAQIIASEGIDDEANKMARACEGHDFEKF